MIEYETGDGQVDGVSVAEKIGHPVTRVFKTLVAKASAQKLFVFIIPVAEELDLKAAAKVVGEKKIEMLAVKDLLGYTGYVRGGCSPVGMKKLYPTVIDESALGQDSIIVSAGKIGMQIHVQLDDLKKYDKGTACPYYNYPCVREWVVSLCIMDNQVQAQSLNFL